MPTNPSASKSEAQALSITNCKWCMEEIEFGQLEQHLENSCSLVPIQCALQDTEILEEECRVEVRGRVNFHTHRENCTFQGVHCPNEKCNKLVSKRSMDVHLQTCKFQSISCPLCQAKYFRMDEDFHLSVCPFAKISCPLGCGIVLQRCDLASHFNESLLDHSYINLQCEKFLPPDHPSMVYAVLLKTIKELKMQQQHASINEITPSTKPACSSAQIRPLPTSPPCQPRTSPQPPPPTSPQRSNQGSAADGPRNSQLPPEHMQRYEDCLKRLEQFSQELRDSSQPSSSQIQASKDLLHEVDERLSEIQWLESYVDPNGRTPPPEALATLQAQRTTLVSYAESLRSMEAQTAIQMAAE